MYIYIGSRVTVMLLALFDLLPAIFPSLEKIVRRFTPPNSEPMGAPTLKMMETILESFPQAVLQLYIAAHLNKLDVIRAICISTSLFSISYINRCKLSCSCSRINSDLPTYCDDCKIHIST